MILYSPDQEKVMGPFTPADNEEHAQLWTPVLEGDQLVIEVQLPKDKIPELGLHLSTVNHDFMGFAQYASGNCNLDVICDAGDGYEFVDASSTLAVISVTFSYNESIQSNSFKLLLNISSELDERFWATNNQEWSFIVDPEGHFPAYYYSE